MPEEKEYPRRVKVLQNQVAALNGDEITAAQSRQLIRSIAECTLDLWDKLLTESKPQKGINEKVEEMYPAYKVGKWLVILLTTTNVVFLVENILAHVFPK